MEEEITAKISTFLRRSLHVEELNDHDDFFKSGLANSLFALELVNFVEREFKCKVDNAELKLANFGSIAGLRSFVLSKRVALAHRG